MKKEKICDRVWQQWLKRAVVDAEVRGIRAGRGSSRFRLLLPKRREMWRRS